MEQIAAEASVTKPILYRHFGDRAGLAEALVERFAVMVSQVVRRERSAEIERQVRRQISAGLRVIEENPGLYEFLAREAVFGLDEERAERNIAPLVEYLAQLLRAQGRDPRMAEVWAHAVAGALDRSILWWVRTGKVLSLIHI